MMSLALSGNASGARQAQGNVYGAIGPDSRRISKLSSSLHSAFPFKILPNNKIYWQIVGQPFCTNEIIVSLHVYRYSFDWKQ